MKTNENEFSSGLKSEQIWIESSSFIERQVQKQDEQYFCKVMNSQHQQKLNSALVVQLFKNSGYKGQY